MPKERLGRSPDELRAGVVRARLSNLMAVLGEPALPPLSGGGLAARPFPEGLGAPAREGRLLPRAVPGDALGRVVDCVVPTGLIVLHARRVPGNGPALEHIVVAPRGLVVVAPSWAGAGDGRQPDGKAGAHCAQGRSAPGRSGHRRARAGRTDTRSEAVRGAVRRAGALRRWLAGSAWHDVPVLGAVCSAPVEGYVSFPPVLVDGLWVGSLERLPSWLAAGTALTAAERAAIGYYLVSELDSLYEPD